MANITTYLENRLLNQSIGVAPTSPVWHTGTYAGLFINAPTVVGTDGTEVGSTDAGYVRKPIVWGSASSGMISNSAALTWNASGYWNNSTAATTAASIGTIGIFDAQTTGNLLWFGPLSTSITMTSGDSFTIPVGNLNITLL